MADQGYIAGRLRKRSPRADIDEAAHGLFRRAPEASAGRRLAPPLVLLLGPTTFLLGLALAAPGAAVAALACAIYLYIAVISLTRLFSALLRPQYAARKPLSDADLPVISVIVALYRESEVVAGLCASLQRLNYPADRLEVILALEADDVETLAAARPAARRAGYRLLIAPAGEPRTKPRALNYALQTARGELVAIYDAEDAPSPSQLRAAAESFAADDTLGVLQAPLSWYNAEENWLTRQFALEYAAQFHALLPFLARLRAPLPLGGTSNVFRRSALEACGGWDPFNVTEDADLGFRLARSGWSAAAIAPGTGEEAPITLTGWTGQRSRWLKGHFVTWLVQMRRPRALIETAGWRGLAVLQVTMLANIFSALAQAPGWLLWLSGCLAIAFGEAGLLTAAGVSLGVFAWGCAIASLVAGARRAGVRCSPVLLISAPVYWLCQLPAAWRALNELSRYPYVWAKTRHGVSSKRREAPDDSDHDAGPYCGERRAVRPDGMARQPSQ